MKKIILLIFAMLLTGCSAKANIKLNEDGTVIEKVGIYEFSNLIDTEGLSMKDYVDSLIDSYDYNSEIRNYDYHVNKEDDLLGVVFERKYDDLCSYISQSYFVNDFISEVNCDKKNGVYNINGIVNYFNCGDDCFELPPLDSAILTINANKKLLSDDADNISSNSYVWEFNSNKKNKSINLKVAEEFQGLKKITNKYIIIISGIAVFIFIVIIMLYIKYKKNKIDY